MTLTRWYVRAGRPGAWQYAVVIPGGVSLVPDEAEATRFATKAEALALQDEIAAQLGCVVERCPVDDARLGPGPDRPAAHAE